MIVQIIGIVNGENNLQINRQTKIRENYSPENSLIHTKSML